MNKIYDVKIMVSINVLNWEELKELRQSWNRKFESLFTQTWTFKAFNYWKDLMARAEYKKVLRQAETENLRAYFFRQVKIISKYILIIF